VTLSIKDYIENHKETLDKNIQDRITKLSIPNTLKESMLYSLQAGGKKIRPILLFASFEAYGKNLGKTYSTAIALEMIHTYSLIHDDLPAMDDDDYRRGQLTNHKKFDEATAILAGDALLTYSFELIAEDPLLTSEEKVHIIQKLSSASGPKGMVAGQVLDMEGEKKSLTLDELEQIHDLKTGELLKFAVYAGAYLGKATENQLQHVTDYARFLGLIFQVQDDILDITGSEELLGKPVGSDVDNEKSTYPKLLGLDGAEKQKETYVEQAKKALYEAGAIDTQLNEMVNYISNRNH
jgi:geranylgeranyl diphosphate synthase type II